MADEVQQGIQMIQLTGQAVGASVRVSAFSLKAIITALQLLLKGLGAFATAGKRKVSTRQRFKSFNEFATKTGQTLIEETITDRDIKAVKHELTHNGVNFAIYKDHNGEHRLFVSAANEATLRVALEKVIAEHGKNSQTKSQQPTPASAPKLETEQQPKKEPIPFYNMTIEEAKTNPDIGQDAFIASHQATAQCRDELDKALHIAHSEHRLPDYLKEMVQTYGSERVKAVLVYNVQRRGHDARINTQNKGYAAGQPALLVDDAMAREYLLTQTHPGIIDLAVSDFRKLEAERTEPSVEQEAQEQQPEPPKAEETKAAEQAQPVSEQEVPDQEPDKQPDKPLQASFDERLDAATQKAKELNAKRGNVAERTAEAARDIPHKVPVQTR